MGISDILKPKTTEEVDMWLSLMSKAEQFQYKLFWRLQTTDFNFKLFKDPYIISKVSKLIYELNEHNLKYEIKVIRDLPPIDRIEIFIYDFDGRVFDVYINIKKGII